MVGADFHPEVFREVDHVAAAVTFRERARPAGQQFLHTIGFSHAGQPLSELTGHLGPERALPDHLNFALFPQLLRGESKIHLAGPVWRSYAQRLPTKSEGRSQSRPVQ